MSKISTFISLMKNDRKAIGKAFFDNFSRTQLSHLIPDKQYLKIQYRLNFGKKLDLKNPQTFNEKLQWLKLYNRNPEFVSMVDKYEVKKYIADIIGEQYVIPTLAVYDSVDEIDLDSLPEQFVLKCTHDSGSIFICKNKDEFDFEGAKRALNKGLKKNMFWYGREWPYKDVKPRVIAEKYMVDDETEELRDYKFFCFNGDVNALFIATDRQKADEETKFDFFDENFNHLPFVNGHPNATTNPSKPKEFEKMKELASELSKGIPHVRVDFYEVNGKIYFGELTFSHYSGFVPFKPEMWDLRFGEWIKLPKIK